MTEVLTEDFDDLSAFALSGTQTLRTGVTGLCLSQTGTASWVDYTIPAPNESDVITLGAWVRVANTGPAGAEIVNLRSDAGVTAHNRLYVTTVAALRFDRGTTSIATTAASLVTLNVWHFMELQCRLHDTAGFVIVRWDGAEVINATGLDTRNAGTKAVYDRIRLGSNTVGGIAALDDFYVRTGAGETFAGQRRFGSCTETLREPFENLTNWATVSGAPAIVAGRTGNAVQLTNTNVIAYNFPAPSQSYEFIVGFWLSIGTVITAADFLSIRSDSGAVLHCNLRLNANGSLTLLRAGSTQVGPASPLGTLAVNTSYYLELHFLFHDTGGFMDVRVNGASVMTVADGDTRQGGVKTVIDQIRLTGIGTGTPTRYDDLYLLTGTTCAFLGSIIIPTGVNAKVYNGSAFVAAPVKVWNGSAFVDAVALKTWNGSAFVVTP